MQIKSDIELNNKESTIYQNTVARLLKAGFRGKFIVINVYIRKENILN